jgi:hypothetical protein
MINIAFNSAAFLWTSHLVCPGPEDLEQIFVICIVELRWQVGLYVAPLPLPAATRFRTLDAVCSQRLQGSCKRPTKTFFADRVLAALTIARPCDMCNTRWRNFRIDPCPGHLDVLPFDEIGHWLLFYANPACKLRRQWYNRSLIPLFRRGEVVLLRAASLAAFWEFSRDVRGFNFVIYFIFFVVILLRYG